MGEPLWIQEKNPEDGEFVHGIFMFSKGWSEAYFYTFGNFAVFFLPPPLLRLAPLDSRFPHGRAILSTSRNSQYT